MLLVLACAVTGFVSISAFASLVVILICITRFAVELKMCAITAGIKKYKSIIKKKRKKHEENKGKLMILSKCLVCDIKKLKFIK